jgi:hypothetical protein
MDPIIIQISQLLLDKKYSEAATATKEFIARGGNVNQVSVSFANKLLLGADWQLISRLLPAETNFFDTSGWIKSMEESRPVARDGTALPWLNYAAIDFIGTKLNKSMSVYEWGSGFSTLWMAQHVGKICTVEDDNNWYGEIKPKLPENASIRFAENGDQYVNSILDTEGKFDVVQIDGSHRVECAKICVDKVKDDGFIIFDNSDEEKFDEAMLYLESKGFYRIDFLGLIPSYAYKNCTSIFFRDIRFLKNNHVPSKTNYSTGITCIQSMNRMSRL